MNLKEIVNRSNLMIEKNKNTNKTLVFFIYFGACGGTRTHMTFIAGF